MPNETPAPEPAEVTTPEVPAEPATQTESAEPQAAETPAPEPAEITTAKGGFHN